MIAVSPNPLADAEAPLAIVVTGASGGLGSALCRELLDRFPNATATGLGRSPPSFAHERLGFCNIDLFDEAAWTAHAPEIPARIDVLLHAVGGLHGPGLTVEKALSDVHEDEILAAYRVNAVSFLLAMKHLKGRLRREGCSLVAALSAQVGSIGDNRSGGWYGYRMAKAGLNMGVRNVALELRGRAITVAIHPGTTATRLSAPFVARRSPASVASPEASAKHILDVLARLTPAETGRFFSWRGIELPW